MTVRAVTNLIKGALIALAFACLISNWTIKGQSTGRQLDERVRNFSEANIASNEQLNFLRSDKILSHLPDAPAGQEDKPVEQTRKNIQVLKGLPESQLFAVMNFMRASLGVSCAHCHVNAPPPAGRHTHRLDTGTA